MRILMKAYYTMTPKAAIQSLKKSVICCQIESGNTFTDLPIRTLKGIPCVNIAAKSSSVVPRICGNISDPIMLISYNKDELYEPKM